MISSALGSALLQVIIGFIVAGLDVVAFFLVIRSLKNRFSSPLIQNFDTAGCGLVNSVLAFFDRTFPKYKIKEQAKIFFSFIAIFLIRSILCAVFNGLSTKV